MSRVAPFLTSIVPAVPCLACHCCQDRVRPHRRLCAHVDGGGRRASSGREPDVRARPPRADLHHARKPYGASQEGYWIARTAAQTSDADPARPPAASESDGAGEGNRTLVFSLEGCCSTIELHPHSFQHRPSPSGTRPPISLWRPAARTRTATASRAGMVEEVGLEPTKA
jgi:hypothetical protein